MHLPLRLQEKCAGVGGLLFYDRNIKGRKEKKNNPSQPLVRKSNTSNTAHKLYWFNCKKSPAYDTQFKAIVLAYL